MGNKLIESSLEEESSFSSNIHAIETITKDVNTEGMRDYPIPQRYNTPKLVLLPVNKEKYFFYWDFPKYYTDENGLGFEDISFHILDDHDNVIAIIQCNSDFGQYFYTLDKEASFIKVIAIHDDGKFLESKSIKVFNKEIKYDSKDVWIEKTGGFTEVIRASMNHFTLGMSSKSYMEEIRRLEEYSRVSIEGVSSDALGAS